MSKYKDPAEWVKPGARCMVVHGEVTVSGPFAVERITARDIIVGQVDGEAPPMEYLTRWHRDNLDKWLSRGTGAYAARGSIGVFLVPEGHRLATLATARQDRNRSIARAEDAAKALRSGKTVSAAADLVRAATVAMRAIEALDKIEAADK